MKRREFITGIFGAAASGAHAQQPAMPVIGFLDTRSPDVLVAPTGSKGFAECPRWRSRISSATTGRRGDIDSAQRIIRIEHALGSRQIGHHGALYARRCRHDRQRRKPARPSVAAPQEAQESQREEQERPADGVTAPCPVQRDANDPLRSLAAQICCAATPLQCRYGTVKSSTLRQLHEAARVHRTGRLCGSGVAARDASAAGGDAGGRDVAPWDTRNCRKRIVRLSQRP